MSINDYSHNCTCPRRAACIGVEPSKTREIEYLSNIEHRLFSKLFRKINKFFSPSIIYCVIIVHI